MANKREDEIMSAVKTMKGFYPRKNQHFPSMITILAFKHTKFEKNIKYGHN